MFYLIMLHCFPYYQKKKKNNINSLDIQLISSVSPREKIRDSNFMSLQVNTAWLIETVRLCYDKLIS